MPLPASPSQRPGHSSVNASCQWIPSEMWRRVSVTVSRMRHQLPKIRLLPLLRRKMESPPLSTAFPPGL